MPLLCSLVPEGYVGCGSSRQPVADGVVAQQLHNKQLEHVLSNSTQDMLDLVRVGHMWVDFRTQV